ncbi:MAG: hypothetical protein ACK5QE_09685 [Sphingobacteriia bacterium]
MEEKITAAYLRLVNTEYEPINAHTVAEAAGITEAELYQYFSGADAVGARLWLDLGQEVSAALRESEVYASYPARQKMLSYFFTFFELALRLRTFIDYTVQDKAILKPYREAFKALMEELVQEGLDAEDIKDRLALSRNYPDMLWELHLKLIRIWLHDTSAGFAETEKAIEHYSKLPLELIGPNLLDSVADTVKYQLEKMNVRVRNPFRF